MTGEPPVIPETVVPAAVVPDGAIRRIKVLIADDHPVVRQGLRVLLEVQDDMDVVGEAPDGPDVARLAAELAPDVILLDLKMPGMRGTDVIADLRARRIPARTLVLTSVTDPAAAQAAVQAGACGFLYKDVDPDVLVRAIRSVHDGNLLLSPEAADTVFRRGADRAATGGLAALTEREREVLGHIARGQSNREIARALNVAEKTVKTHVSSVLAKLGVQDRTQAALYAVARDGDHGWGTGAGAGGRQRE
ncbi:MAG TPA: response regulator transcription factor [Streptosporangiaceae bacterium]|nr:response regulator transcription factor [Streptosporangiaceae bacterium]